MSRNESELDALIAELMSTGLYDEAGARREAESLLPTLHRYARVWDAWTSVQVARQRTQFARTQARAA